ncbi:MAG: ABC transporter permease [Chlorobi bacterium]|nr:ABC transporter permease [Chlorobiota bacterium]
MNTALLLARSAFWRTIRSRVVVGYGVGIAGIVAAFSSFGGDPSKVTLTLVSLLLLIVPLVTLIIVAIEYYNNREFTELMLAQPIGRRAYYWGQWTGTIAALGVMCIVPLTAGYAVWQNYDVVLVETTALVLTLCFGALAYRVAVGQPDKAKGIGIAMLVWFYCAVLYDAVLVAMMALLEEYPLEKALLVLLALNPIDAIRVAVLLHSDSAALLGITGAVLREFFGTERSLVAIAVVVSIWIGYPLLRGERIFRRRDF